MEVKLCDEVLEALMKKQQFYYHSAKIHNTGNVHISHAFTISYIYVIYYNIRSVIRYRQKCVFHCSNFSPFTCFFADQLCM